MYKLFTKMSTRLQRCSSFCDTCFACHLCIGVDCSSSYYCNVTFGLLVLSNKKEQNNKETYIYKRKTNAYLESESLEQIDMG